MKKFFLYMQLLDCKLRMRLFCLLFDAEGIALICAGKKERCDGKIMKLCDSMLNDLLLVFVQQWIKENFGLSLSATENRVRNKCQKNAGI